MEQNNHNVPQVAETDVRYLPPDSDPNMYEYDNIGDAWVVETDNER